MEEKFTFPYNLLWDAHLGECSKWKNEQEFNDLYHADGSKVRGAFWFILGNMQERTVEIILKRYKDGMTYSAIGQEIGLSVERCRQLVEKGKYNFRRQKNVDFLLNGLCETYEKKIAEESHRQYERGKGESLAELLEFLNNKAITIEQLREFYIENRKSTNPFLDMTIEEFTDEFKLSVRTYNCIVRALCTQPEKERTPEEIIKLRRRGVSNGDIRCGVYVVRDLASMTDEEIRAIKNLGQKSYMELIHALKLAGITPKSADGDKERESA